MSEFLSAAFTMPTTIFSVLLILVGLYWLTVILGAMDVEIFDSLFEGLGGAAEGALEGAAEGTLEGAAEALDGAFEGAAEGAVESVGGFEADVGEAGGCRRGCVGWLGLGEIPVTITGTILLVFAWGFSYGGMAVVKPMAMFAAGGLLAILAVFVAAIGLAVVATTIAIKPLRKLTRSEPPTSRHDLVGKTCTVTTRRVDESFGQAEVVDKTGAVILIQARCPEANDLGRGSKALIFDYRPEREVFLVSPLEKRPELAGKES